MESQNFLRLYLSPLQFSSLEAELLLAPGFIGSELQDSGAAALYYSARFSQQLRERLLALGVPWEQVSTFEQSELSWTQLGLQDDVITERFHVCTARKTPLTPSSKIQLALTPGLGFGTGHHETTAMCLEHIEQLEIQGVPACFYDVGAGSGVLSIAAALLFQNCVGVACDTHLESCFHCAENIRHNQLGDRISTYCGSWNALHRPADVVFANIYASLLVELALSDELVFGPRCQLIISGFQEADETKILTSYAQLGFQCVKRSKHHDWVAWTLSR